MAATRLRLPAGHRARAGLGAGVVLVYLGAAVVSSHLSPLARHPLLDGTGTPQPYHWVSPPPDQAGSNIRPRSVTQTQDLSKQGGAGYVFTPDGQAAVIMGNRTFRGIADAGQTSVVMSIKPLDPATLGALPPGRRANGNAYRVTAAFQPSGTGIPQFGAAVTVTFIYPPIATVGVRPTPRTIMWSRNGTTWKPITTQDSHAGLQAAASTKDTGYFLVVTPPVATAAQSASRLRILSIAILIALALFVVGGGVYILRARRREEA